MNKLDKQIICLFLNLKCSDRFETPPCEENHFLMYFFSDDSSGSLWIHM